MKTLKEWQIERIAEETGLNPEYLSQFMGSTSFKANPEVLTLLRSKGVVKDVLDIVPDPNEAIKSLLSAFASEALNLGRSFDVSKWRGALEREPEAKV